MKKLTMFIVLVATSFVLRAQEPVNSDLSIEIVKQFPTSNIAHDRANPVFIDIVNNEEEVIESLEEPILYLLTLLIMKKR